MYLLRAIKVRVAFTVTVKDGVMVRVRFRYCS